jgi:iron complex outermembrane receptor protein
MNHGLKTDFNIYWKNNYQLSSKLNGFVDWQFRSINYTAAGIENNLNAFNFHQHYSFFNPKAGLTYQVLSNMQAYSSYAVANREPVRDDFVDAVAGREPKPEMLYDTELGFRKRGERFSFNVNYYWMDYKNQLVLTGALNDVGASIRTNVLKSYRTGIELEVKWAVASQLMWAANLTLSQSKIKNFTEVLYDYGNDFDQFNEIKKKYGRPDISFSPKVIAGSALSYKFFKGFEGTLLTKFVGKQYLDNTSNKNRKIDPYTVHDARLVYTLSPKGTNQFTFSLLLNNILDVKYSSNGYTYGFLGGVTTYRQNYYYPQAGRNFMAMVGMRF